MICPPMQICFLIKGFIKRSGIDRLLCQSFNTNNSALFRYHTDKENLLRLIYMIIADCIVDNASHELTSDPVFKPMLNKETLASQPKISRFHNHIGENPLNQFYPIN